MATKLDNIFIGRRKIHGNLSRFRRDSFRWDNPKDVSGKRGEGKREKKVVEVLVQAKAEGGKLVRECLSFAQAVGKALNVSNL